MLYVIIVAKLKPAWAPPLSASDRLVALPAPLVSLGARNEQGAMGFMLRTLRRGDSAAEKNYLRKQLFVALVPALLLAAMAFWSYQLFTAEERVDEVPAGLERMGAGGEATSSQGGLAEPPGSGESAAPSGSGLAEPPTEPSPPAEGGLAEPPGSSDTPAAASDASGLAEPPGAAPATDAPTAAGGLAEPPAVGAPPGGASATPIPQTSAAEPPSAPRGYWIAVGLGALALLAYYALLNFNRLEIFKMLLSSFFPLVILILSVLGSIVFGLATPTEAAAVGAFGGYVLACIYALVGKRKGRVGATLALWLLLWVPALVAIGWFLLGRGESNASPVPPWLGWLAVAGIGVWCVVGYRQAGLQGEVKESVYLTAKTSAMVCWLFVGSAIFSAAFALLGGQELVEQWVLGMNLSKTQFLLLTQVIIFILGWPLEWTEIIVIFMPIFVPLLDNFGVDPLFFGLLVALNLQTAFLSPPVAMAAFYLKGVSPPHVTLNQIFLGMLPFMGIQILAIVLLYVFPQIGLWLPQILYK